MYIPSVWWMWGFPEISSHVSFPAHVGKNPKLVSDQITLCFAGIPPWFYIVCYFVSVWCARPWAFVFSTARRGTSEQSPDSSAGVYVFHNPSLYGILFRLLLRGSSVSCSLWSQQRNPTPAVWMFVSHVYFCSSFASFLPSFHLLPSFIIWSK